MGGNVLKLEVDPLLESLAQMKLEWKNEGWREGLKIGAQGMLLKNVQLISERIGMSFEETMNLLNVTDENREFCREHLPLTGRN